MWEKGGEEEQEEGGGRRRRVEEEGGGGMGRREGEEGGGGRGRREGEVGGGERGRKGKAEEERGGDNKEGGSESMAYVVARPPPSLAKPNPTQGLAWQLKKEGLDWGWTEQTLIKVERNDRS